MSYDFSQRTYEGGYVFSSGDIYFVVYPDGHSVTTYYPNGGVRRAPLPEQLRGDIEAIRRYVETIIRLEQS